MTNYKTVPNQKVVKVKKEICDKQHLYATINLEAMEQAAQMLDAGAFKLWCYFAKNQNNFEFALSSKDVLETFGMKIKQYNNAMDELKTKGFLTCESGNRYTFNESGVITKEDNEANINNSVITKEDNAVITKKDNHVITKEDNALLPLEIRNTTNNTLNTTNDNTVGVSAKAENAATANSQGVKGRAAEVMTATEAMKKFGLSACANKIPSAAPKCFWINGVLVKLV